MNHPPYVNRHSITDDFLTYGNEGIGLNRAAELRLRDRADRQADAARQATGRIGSLRRRAGTLLIATGTALAGSVPTPSPEASEPGTV